MNELLKSIEAAMDSNDRVEVAIGMIKLGQLVQDESLEVSLEDFEGLRSDTLKLMAGGFLMLITATIGAD